MKKNSSMQGTLNKLFGKKNSSTNSLYAENPPWMKPQGVKKTSVDYHDDITKSFSFLDDSGTATLKARPGPRARPVLQFSTSNTDSQGLAVPTPSVPSGYSENHSIGNGSKFNGNYRMYSSVGDLHLTNYYDYPDEEIPAPPSMPPPPPPTMIPAPPPQGALSDTSPVSPSLPDFIPPTPNSSATAIPNFEPSKDTSTVSVVSEQRQTDNISKWKSEGSKDLPMTLPNRFSLNSAVFQNSHGQTNNDVGSHASLPKTFKVPPPAPARTSSIQLQEHQNISYSVEPPPSPVPSSFNPSVQAKLYLASNPGKKNLDDTLNKRKSMIIMEDLNDLSQDHTIPRNVSKTDTATSGLWSLKSTMNAKTPIEPDIERKPGAAVLSDNNQESESGFNNQKQNNKISINGRELPMMVSEKNTGGSKRAMSSIEINKMSFPKDVYLPTIHKNTKDTVKILSMKPIITDIPLSNTNVQLEQNSLARKFVDKEELTEMENDVKIDQKATAAIIKQEPPPTPPPMPPPPPPIMTPPKPPAVTPPKPPAVPQPPPPPPITPQKTFPTSNFVAPPPAPTLVASMPPVPQVSPLLAPKPKAISTSAVVVPPPAPPKAPPVPPPLPSIGGTSNPEPQMPFLKALQEKQQTLRQIPKKPIEIRPAQVSSIDVSGDEEQKVRVGKIKGELEALFSPKKDGKFKDLSSQPSLDVNKKSSNGNNLVNSLMMKVPHIPSVSDKEDIDGDTSEWIPKSNNTNFQIPEPDYSPISPTKTIEKPTYSDKQSNIPKPVFMTPLKPASPPKSTEVTRKKINDTPAYIPPPPKSTEVTRKKINDIPAYIPPSPSNSTEVTRIKINDIPAYKSSSPSNSTEVARIKINDIPAYKSSSPSNSTEATRIKVNDIPAYKPHNQRKPSAENLALEKITLAISETPTVVTLKNDEAIPYPASSLKTEYVINQEEDTKKHPVTGEKVEANSPMALLLAAKQRAQKGSRSLPLERSSLPKMSVSSGIETSPLIPQYNDVKTNTFVVVPKKEIGEQHSEEEVTSLSSKPGGYLDNASSSKWTDRGFISSKVNNLGLHPQNSNDVGVKSVGLVPTEHRNEDFWKFKSSVAEKYNSTDVPSFNDAYTFNISSVPSPVPALKTYEDTDYGIIPPPMEFMNTPPSTDIEMSQKDRSFDNNNTRSDLRLNYEWSNEGNRSLRSHTLSYNSDFNKQTFDNYNVGMNKDPQRVSLIKKRLYMPDPESSGTYGKSTHSLRTSTLPVSYSHMQTQSSSSMIPESRRTVNPSRYMTQGRRVSSENMVPSMNDGKYKHPNPEYGKSMSRPPNTYQQGMTFTVRPGTRQPISHMYQGGYL